jgi:hypothetical protein
MKNITVGNHQASTSASWPGWELEEFVNRINSDGFAIIERSWPRPTHHRLIGSGVGHDDAQFAEIGRSMAAYYENGEAFEGLRWWEDTHRYFSIGVTYYGMAPAECERCPEPARTTVAGHDFCTPCAEIVGRSSIEEDWAPFGPAWQREQSR